jgi:7tm Chemosensory receptor
MHLLGNLSILLSRRASELCRSEELCTALDELTYLRLTGDLEPNALGFFGVNRGTLTGMFSTILTYMIILIQFNQTGQPIKQAVGIGKKIEY